MGSSDDNLLNRACEGDGEALGRLLERNAAALRAHVAGRIPKRWQVLLSADDVVQQTFADAFLNVRQVVSRSESAFVAWLHRIAEHNVGSALRGLEAEKRGGDRQKIEFRTRDDSLAELCAMAATPQSTASRDAAKREAIARLEQAIEQLPENYRMVVRQFDLEGRAAEEIARSLGRSRGAVYMIRARAHCRLGRLLGGASRLFTNG